MKFSFKNLIVYLLIAAMLFSMTPNIVMAEETSTEQSLVTKTDSAEFKLNSANSLDGYIFRAIDLSNNENAKGLIKSPGKIVGLYFLWLQKEEYDESFDSVEKIFGQYLAYEEDFQIYANLNSVTDLSGIKLIQVTPFGEEEVAFESSSFTTKSFSVFGFDWP